MMYSIAKDSITISIHVYMGHKMAKVLALLDSGATENFIRLSFFGNHHHKVASLRLVGSGY